MERESPMENFCCPVCGEPLRCEEGSLFCPRRHCYDIAKSGYVNLLRPDQMHSKLPGDNREMVRQRSTFLDLGYYSSLRETVAGIAAGCAKRVEGNPFILLDAGCGEGYYTAGMAQALTGTEHRILGIDISKFALQAAAKRVPEAAFGVASTFHLPLRENSCHLVSLLFAPFCREEIYRVLKSDGYFLMVIPGRQHLYGLKQAVYEHPYENEVKAYTIEGFELCQKELVEDRILLKSREEIESLFAMTPYAYRTSPQDYARLHWLEKLETEIAFEVLLYRCEK